MGFLLLKGQVIQFYFNFPIARLGFGVVVDVDVDEVALCKARNAVNFYWRNVTVISRFTRKYMCERQYKSALNIYSINNTYFRFKARRETNKADRGEC